MSVLVVDNNEPARKHYTDALRHSGLSVLQAASGDEAVALLRRYPVDAVVLSARLPGASWPDTLGALRASGGGRTLPVLLVGGEGQADAGVAALGAGADDYLAGPVRADELVARLHARLRGQAAWRCLVDEHVHDRATVTGLLHQVRVEATPELTMAGACHELTRHDEIASAAAVAFTDAGEAVPLALSGTVPPPATVGWPLPRRTARLLRTAAEGGPWTADPRSMPFALLADPSAPFAVYAPLRSRGTLLGALVVTPGSGAPDDTRTRLLGSCVDVAAVLSALVATALEEWEVTTTARAELEWVLGGAAFSTVFQPIQNVQDDEVVGYEALTRFADGRPAEPRFLEAAQVGLGLEIEAATLASAVLAADWLPDDAWLSVNVSPGFVLQGDCLLRAVRSSDRRLVLELTEHDPIEDYAAIRTAVDRLGPGVRLSVDDTGTGYASLNHVLSLRPEFVKLDRCWVHGIDADPARQALVAGLQHFASRTGAALIAEGVETVSELDALRGLHVPLAQGFLLGRPLSVPAD